MKYLDFRNIPIWNDEKINAINFNEYSLPKDYFIAFLFANEHAFNETGEGISIMLASDHYFNKDNSFLFMLCIPFIDKDEAKIKYNTIPFNWVERNTAFYLDGWALEFDYKEDAIKYITQFKDVHTGPEIGKIVQEQLSKTLN